MFKDLCNVINKFFFPSRFARGLSCNDGFWWFIPAIANAIGSVAAGAAGAIGSAAGAIGSGIGSLLGIGSGAAAAGTAGSAIGGVAGGSTIAALPSAATVLGSAGVGAGVGAAAPIGSLAAAQAAGTGALLSGAGGAAGAGALAPGLSAAIAPGATAGALANAGLPVVGASVAKEGLVEGVAGLLSKELLGFDPKAGLKENAGNMAVKQAEGAMAKKTAPTPVNIDNSVSMQSPQTTDSAPAKKTGKDQQSLSPEQMMQLVQIMRRQQAQGGSRPIASGRYY